MADDDASSAKSRFKSKWHRVFKEKEEHEINPQHTNSFKLNDDVSDFLKPSSERAAGTRPLNLAPKIDIAIAQRWPTANEVRAVSSGADTPNGFTKPRRRQGLTVGFVKTQPEIIGEGGDDSEEPPSEVARRRVARGRSASNFAPGPMAEVLQPQGIPSEQPLQQGSSSHEQETQFEAPPLRRVQTSHYEYSPSLQKRQPVPVVPAVQPEMPRLIRTPTGFGTADEQMNTATSHEIEPTVPRIETNLARDEPQSLSGSTGTSNDPPSATPKSPEMIAARKRELSSGEGMILRRASAMIRDHDMDEVQKRQSFLMGVQLPSQHYETLSRPDAPSLMPEVPPPRSALTPSSAMSPAGPNPFADPKYVKRHSHEVAPAELPHRPTQSEQDEQRDYQPSYMRSAQPQAPPPTVQSVQPRQQPYQPSYMRAVQPQVPVSSSNQASVPQLQNQPSIHENAPPLQLLEQPGQMPTQRRPSAQQYQISPPPQTSPDSRPGTNGSQSEDRLTNMRVPSSSHLPREQSPSGYSKYFTAPRAVSSKPNSLGSSPSYFPPPPGTAHSRSSSRDSGSSRAQVSAASGVQSQALRSTGYSASPKSGSPRASWYGGPTSGSPHNLSPADSYTMARGAPIQTSRSPLGYARQPSSQTKPGSSGSDQAAQRPVPGTNFSVPRSTPEHHIQQQARPSSAYLSELDSARPSSSDSNRSGPRSAASGLASQLPVATDQRPQGMPRSASSDSRTDTHRPAISSQPSAEINPAAEGAYADFAARVAHMKGVFRLTAEKERPTDRCTPVGWLRTALWWYLSGKAGLELLLRQRPRGNDGQVRELLTQPHVDLAKTWWILTDPLEPYQNLEDTSPQSAASSSGHPDAILRQSIGLLRSHIKTLALSLSRNGLMPPPASLIQGQDTRIWLEYPRFTEDAMLALGSSQHSASGDTMQRSLAPLDVLPIGDTQSTHCYGRFPVEVAINTDDPHTDRVPLPCTLTMLRGRQDFACSMVIASQNELIDITIGPQHGGERSLTWYDVAWKASSPGMTIRLPNNFDMSVRIHDKDFRTLWNLVEYARRVGESLQADNDEILIHEAQLAELQYSDSSNSNAFPQDKTRGAMALAFERTAKIAGHRSERKVHRGYRLLLVTDPNNRSLACVSHEVGLKGPLYFEFMTDSSANGMAAMVIRIHEEAKCRILLVFPSAEARQNLYHALNGMSVGSDEMIVGKMDLAGLNIEPATHLSGLSHAAHVALQGLQWQRLGVTNGTYEDSNDHSRSTVQSPSLRIVSRHTTGCVTDRLNIAKGELFLRVPCSNEPSVQIFRSPQDDISMSIDTRMSHPSVCEGIAELMQLAQQQTTIRTYTFNSHQDLHAFQAAITGCFVRYDGLASTFSIARRRMVVPIYKKWEASKVRLQIVSYDTVVQVLAFMEDFSHTDAMCFQVKSTDTFENVKGDGKGKKWAVKMVDAKFSLPHIPENNNEEGAVAEDAEARVRRRFVNLEGLEYAEEHDDVTVGFETQEERDRCAQALPAAPTVGRGITLKRRT